MSLFLTDDELYELTDYKKPPKQIEWLRNRRYPFEISARGRPRVLRSYIRQRLEGGRHIEHKEPRLILQ